MDNSIWNVPKGTRKFWGDIFANACITAIAIIALFTQPELPAAFWATIGISLGGVNGVSRIANIKEHQANNGVKPE